MATIDLSSSVKLTTAKVDATDAKKKIDSNFVHLDWCYRKKIESKEAEEIGKKIFNEIIERGPNNCICPYHIARQFGVPYSYALEIWNEAEAVFVDYAGKAEKVK